MNSVFSSSGRVPKQSTLWVLAGIGLVIFTLLQILPMTSLDSLGQIQKTITKQQAEKAAAEFAISTFDITNPPGKALVTYDSQSNIYGYLVREKVMDTYLKTYNEQFPLEVFRVRFDNADGTRSTLTVDVNLSGGKVVGFERFSTYSNTVKEQLLKLGWESVESLLSLEGDLSLADKERLAQPYFSTFGFEHADLKAVSSEGELGLVYKVAGYDVGQSQGFIKFNYEFGTVSAVQTYFEPPAAHMTYVKDQKSLAGWFFWIGYALFTFILGILAIIFSVKTRPFSSFVRGIVLSSIYFIFSMVGALNLLPYLQKDGFDPAALIVGFVIQGLLTLLISASIYFSLVGGDGLWRKQGINLWGRANEAGYGQSVVYSMREGYQWALVLLGLQSIIFLIFEKSFGVWSTTDAAQSPYNMAYPLLLPLLAWVAGIGEEAVYRLFGIPMLKNIFRSTFIACFLSSLIWAFGHSLYPIFPVYSRPIELTLIGLMFSFIFLRYGYITAMFTHVIFNSILMSLSLIFMGGALNWSAGLFYIALPALVAFVIYLFNPPGRGRPQNRPVIQQKEEPQFTTPHPEGHL
ncbi:CPBP family intramembrane glutamic endopeptidase [Paenibacillus fonticola]|uniref:CPBP family intramembrane glutamic endopeptidase n=1 Tax=Paenibacillus fonticola TaxID=379896 RepID=UPI00036B651C|nr:type II CAAX endopeptidase family protein [Paenibacillus fonticola]